jgi:hypothetical protein
LADVIVVAVHSDVKIVTVVNRTGLDHRRGGGGGRVASGGRGRLCFRDFLKAPDEHSDSDRKRHAKAAKNDGEGQGDAARAAASRRHRDRTDWEDGVSTAKSDSETTPF